MRDEDRQYPDPDKRHPLISPEQISLIQMVAAQQALKTFQRIEDIQPDRLYKRNPTGAFIGPFKVPRPSTLQILAAGSPASPSQHLMYLMNKTPQATMLTEGDFKIVAGLAWCLQIGDYYLYIPAQTGDPATFDILMSDASSQIPAATAAYAAAAAAGLVQAINLLQVNGQTQTPIDLGLNWKPITWGNGSTVAYLNAADAAVVAANANRRGLTIYNNDAANYVALGVTNPMVAFAGFMILNPKRGFTWGPGQGVTQQAIRSWGAAGGGNLIVCEGT
jgi:hypothetical protein